MTITFVDVMTLREYAIASFAAGFLSAGILLSTANFNGWIRGSLILPLIVIELGFFVYFLLGKILFEYVVGGLGYALALVYLVVVWKQKERAML